MDAKFKNCGSAHRVNLEVVMGAGDERQIVSWPRHIVLGGTKMSNYNFLEARGFCRHPGVYLG